MIKELRDILAKHGLAFREFRYNGFDFLCVRTARSGTERLILPFPTSALSPEEARKEGEKLSDALARLHPLTITEDRWRSKTRLYTARLLAHLEIFHAVYARNCEIRRISKEEAADFLESCHSYGDASCKYRYGMFLKRYTGKTAVQTDETAQGVVSPTLPERLPAGTLVAVAEFSNARKWTKGEKSIKSYEWVRYASLPNLRISGGMGRLLEHFIREVNPDDIMSYADLEWSDGQVYGQLGFEEEGVKAPVDFIIDPQTWKRTALNRVDKTDAKAVTGQPLFFRNAGSKKYRLKLTEY